MHPTASVEEASDDDEDQNSLFGSDSTSSSITKGLDEDSHRTGSISKPPIPGLYFDPHTLLAQDECTRIIQYLETTYFPTNKPTVNQVMLFGGSNGLPPFFHSILDELARLLRHEIPRETYDLLFPSKQLKSRQIIINKYLCGEGITPHVDLLKRFDDGIIGLSLGSGTVMSFEKEDSISEMNVLEGSETGDQADAGDRWDLYLPPGSVIVLSKEARYQWTHGIEKRTHDYVDIPLKGILKLKRGTRWSITFRWLLPDAHIVGSD